MRAYSEMLAAASFTMPWDVGPSTSEPMEQDESVTSINTIISNVLHTFDAFQHAQEMAEEGGATLFNMGVDAGTS